MSIHFVDGAFCEDLDARIPVTDLTVLRGYGIFDYTRTYDGQAFKLDAHLARLERSAQMIGLALPKPLPEIKQIAIETLRRNHYPESSLRIIITGGDTEDGISQQGTPRLIIMVSPLPARPASWYEDGVKIVTECTERYLPEAKTINYIPAIIALKKARMHDAVDAIYVDRRRRVLEGTTTNLFAFFGDTLVTPGADVLRGVTRDVVLDIASDLYEVQTRDLTLDELMKADEVFLTSSSKEVCPVRCVGDTIIGRGRPGARTLRLLAGFRDLAQGVVQNIS